MLLCEVFFSSHPDNRKPPGIGNKLMPGFLF